MNVRTSLSVSKETFRVSTRRNIFDLPLCSVDFACEKGVGVILDLIKLLAVKHCNHTQILNASLRGTEGTIILVSNFEPPFITNSCVEVGRHQSLIRICRIVPDGSPLPIKNHLPQLSFIVNQAVLSSPKTGVKYMVMRQILAIRTSYRHGPIYKPLLKQGGRVILTFGNEHRNGDVLHEFRTYRDIADTRESILRRGYAEGE